MTSAAVAATLADPSKASLKRLAWAYGCARKGSDEERQLEQALRARLRGGADLLAELCEGILGADDDDPIGSIRVHFRSRPSMYLRNAIADAVDAYRAVKP